jgi:PAT family beta-lactamase induction signal transducer AmpG
MGADSVEAGAEPSPTQLAILARGWRVSLGRMLAVIAGLYVIEGFPMAIFRDVWSVYLRERGVSLAAIGVLSGLYVAWSAKVLWSPVVDRFGARQHWIAGALLVIALALLAVAALDPTHALIAVAAAMAFFCLASATQDIAIDAYTIGLVRPGEEGSANGVRVAAYRVAILVFGGGVLLLPRWIGWDGTHQALAVAALALAGFALVTPRIEIAPAARRDVRGAFRSWTSREGVLAVLGFVLLFRLPDLALGPMVRPFWVDAGLSREEIGIVNTGFGFVGTVAGAAAGGWLVQRLGIARSLWIVGGLAVGSNLGYAGAALAGGGRAPVYAASLLESVCTGFATVGFMSFLMRISDRAHAAVQYAALTSLVALPGAAAGALSGLATEQLGYAGFFAATVLLALPAFALLPSAARWADDTLPPPREEHT